MRFISVVSLLLLACDAAVAWGQSSLYASPELIPFAPSDPVYGTALDSTGKPYPPGAVTTQRLPVGPSATQFRYPTLAMAPMAQPGPYVRNPAWQPYGQQAGVYANGYPRLADASPARVPVAQPTRPLVPTPAVPGSVGPAPNGPLAPIPNGNMGPNGSWIAPGEGGGGDGYGYGCGGCDPCGACCPEGPWFVSIVSLFMSRSDGDPHVMSVNRDHQESPLLNSAMDMPWRAGGEIRFGRSFGCNRWAVEGVYWTLADFQDAQTAASSDPYGPVLGYCSTFNDAAGPSGSDAVTIGGIPALQFFDSAPLPQRVERSSQLQNAEINVLCRTIPPGSMPWDFSFVAGPRFFRFDDSLTFETMSTVTVGSTTLPSYAFFRDRMTNTLWGAQAGFDGGLSFFPGLRVYFAPKIGIYGNHVDADYDVAGQLGGGPLQSAMSNTPGYPNYPASGTRNMVSTLSQADVGLDWNFARNWTARIGYRLVAVTGLALADRQVPAYLNDTPDLIEAKSTSSLLIHGAFAGLGWRF